MVGTPGLNSPPIPAAPTGAVSHVRTAQRVYAPTFDCCAHCAGKTGVAHNLINHITSNKIPSTFFLTGKWMMDHPAEARKLIAASNVEVGFHSMVHSDFTLASTNIQHELNGTRSVYNTMLEQMRSSGQISQALYDERKKANLFRFPSGHFNTSSLDAVRRAGYVPVQWNDTADNARDPHLQQRPRQEGNIVLMHANMTRSVQGTDTSFAQYHQRMQEGGYQSAKVSDMLRMGTVQYTNQPERLTQHDWSVINRVQTANIQNDFFRNQHQSWMAQHSTPTTQQRYAQRPTVQS